MSRALTDRVRGGTLPHPGDVVRIRDQRWRVLRHLSHGASTTLEVDGCDVSNHGAHARFLLPFERCERLPARFDPRVIRAARWRRTVRRALADAAPCWTSLRAAGRARLTLIPFQLEPAIALTRGLACRFLIADAVGLGKTVQAGLMIAEVLERTPDGRVLVVVPAGLREQWRDELLTRFDLPAEVIDASALARASALLPGGVNPWSVHSLVITSIDYVKRPDVIRSLETLVWDLIAFDEAHGLTARSDRASAAAVLATRARNVVMLTATPHSGDDDAFERLRGLGDLGGEFPAVIFRRTRADLGLVVRRRSTLLRVQPTPGERAMHAALLEYARLIWTEFTNTSGGRLAATVLLRRACSSASSLARSLERRQSLLANVEPAGGSGQLTLPFRIGDEDDEPEAELGAPGLRNRADEMRWLERLLAHAREAARGESKLHVLGRFLARTREPAIVFTHYRDTLDRIGDAVAQLPSVHLHGGLPPRERRDALRHFTHGTARLLLATDAGSEGLNLHQRCRLVINMEMPWTPLRLEQRVGRVDRLGQTQTVHALHLVSAGTSEEIVVARLVQKEGRIRAALADIDRAPNEEEVAAAVVEGRLTHDAAPARPIRRLSDAPLELQRHAATEAVRLSSSRALADRAALTPVAQPVVTLLTRQRGQDARQLHAFRLLFVDTTDCLVWESLIGLSSPWCRLPDRSVAAVKTSLDVSATLARAVADTQREHLAALLAAMEAPVRLMTRREQAIAIALRRHHARLSAVLLQPGLFDHRRERAATAQAVLMEQALAGCDARLAALDRIGRLREGARLLAFAMARI